uniref:Uncharacterized protein n=1 Tax=viral metagenome TaxID=1070528 RepID=A0A6M3IK09_9ZZZZ
MSDILKRTIFIDDSGGVIRFHDWAVVTTSLGVMMEPCTGIHRVSTDTAGGLSNYDATEPMSRIDAIQRHSLDRGLYIVGEVIHGGRMVPRVGR